MDLSEENDMPSSKPPEVVRQEQVRHWLETGFSDQAVSSYGTSLENFNSILKSGNIVLKPLIDPLQYQRDLSKHGSLLYYFNPIGENLQRENPSFYLQMKQNAEANGQGEEDLSTETSKRNEETYARNNALCDYISTLTGIPSQDLGVEEIEYAISDEIPEEVEKNIKEFYKPPQAADELLGEVINIREKLGHVNTEAIRDRKGIVIYFNKKIFSDSWVTPGIEEPDEFVLVRNRPLRLDVISGIRILSDSEFREFKQEYEI